MPQAGISHNYEREYHGLSHLEGSSPFTTILIPTLSVRGRSSAKISESLRFDYNAALTEPKFLYFKRYTRNSE